MAAPTINDMILYTGTALTNSDWAANWQKAVDYLTTDKDVTFATVTATGAITAGTFSGVGTAITGVLGLVTTKVGNFSRDTATSSGSQSISGVGFKPSFVIFIMSNAATSAYLKSYGFDNLTAANCQYTSNSSPYLALSVDSSYSIILEGAAGGSDKAKISSFDSDGFTIAWTKSGALSGYGTMYIMYAAFK